MSASLNQTLEGKNLDFFAGAPMVYHCHHFNLFLDQSINDALGPEQGVKVRTAAGRDAARQLIGGLIEHHGARTPAERLELAQEIFRAIGHGRLRITADAKSGSAEGEFLHYGFAWREKYGQVVRRNDPADAFAAGFAAAAIELAFDADPFDAEETHCIAADQERCTFSFTSNPSLSAKKIVGLDNITGNDPTGGIEEERIAAINTGLRDFLSGVAGDDRGLVGAFGVYVTRHLTNYYNAISYSSVMHLEQTRPVFVPMLEGLLRESGHVCVFNTIGGILYSPEWDALVGRIQGDLHEVVSSSCAISRALGFGSWSIKELSPDRFVLQTASEYESPYCTQVLGRTTPNSSYFIQGAALAFMRLWEAIDWQDRQPLTPELYNQLFRSGRQWNVQQTQTLAAGDPVTEVVVTRA